MNREPFYLKKIKHKINPGIVRELTFSCYQRRPLLDSDFAKEQLAIAIGRAIPKQGYSLLGFVFMPEHVHLLVFPEQPDASVSNLLRAIKRPHSFRVKQWMAKTKSPELNQLMVQERPGKQTFRFWQEGGGYDRDIGNYDFVHTALEYLHANPIRRGLCDRTDQWKWSSWHHYEGNVIPEGLPAISDIRL